MKTDFSICISIVKEYDGYRGNLNDTLLGCFYFATEYLETLTHIKADYYIACDVPYYNSKEDCLNNIKDWEQWYNNNETKIINLKSDSLRKLVFNKKIWWNDSTILKLVFNKESRKSNY